MPQSSLALAFRYYIWLADTIYSAGYITRDEINRRWRNNSYVNPEGKEELPERTFHNWRHAIEDIFDISIGCSRTRGGAYYIENAEDLREGDMRSWLISTFAANILLSDSRHLKQQILFESIPSGQRFLTPLIEAIRDNRRVEIVYHRFQSQESHAFVVSPYCLKIFKQRWYLLAKSDFNAEPHLYALDRMEGVRLTDNTYTLPKGFDAEEYFSNRYGVSSTREDVAEFVRLRVSPNQAPYFRTLPLHFSQHEVETTAEGTVFEFFIVPNYELQQELHKYAEEVEVLSPEWLREDFRRKAQKLAKMYGS